MSNQEDKPEPPGLPTQAMDPVQVRLLQHAQDIPSRTRSLELKPPEAKGKEPRWARAKKWFAAHPLPRSRRLLAGTGVGLLALAGSLMVWGLWGRHMGGETAGAQADVSRWVGRLPSEARGRVERALAKGELLTALAWVRTLPAEKPDDVPALLLRAHLSLEAREPSDAIDPLEKAAQLDPDVVSDPLFARAAVRSMVVGRSSRHAVLLARIPRGQAVPALEAATGDWSYRVRRGAADTLKSLGAPVPDETGMLMLDLWQADSCDGRQALFRRLLKTKDSDERVGPFLELVAKKRNEDSCLEGLIPKGRGR